MSPPAASAKAQDPDGSSAARSKASTEHIKEEQLVGAEEANGEETGSNHSRSTNEAVHATSNGALDAHTSTKSKHARNEKEADTEAQREEEEQSKALSDSGDRDEDEGDDATENAAGREAAESLRRKRDREGSLEPSLSQKELQTADVLPAKKNRLQGEDAAKPPKKSLDQASDSRPSFEGEKVGHIRKRVQDLSWKQRKEGERDDGQDDEEDEGVHGPVQEPAEIGTESTSSKSAQETVAKEAESSTKPSSPPRNKATFASFSSKSSGFAAGPKTSGSVFEAAAEDTKKTSSPPPAAAMRKQPTFSSFSSSSSPFNSASASVAGPSWLAGKQSSAGGLKPSALGSMGSSSEGRSSSNSPAPASKDLSGAVSGSSSSKPLGFGAFSANKSFATAPASGTSRSSTPLSATSAKGDAAVASDEGPANPKSFDEALRREEDSSHDANLERPKMTALAERGHADLRTGEEDEQTIASVRAKLFTMADDKSWKERGTGTVRCNIGKGNTSSGARLVMRAEGVLRLILNIKLFKGMGINLEQDKFIRIVALEDGKTTTFAIKVGNAATAGHFYRTVKAAIPTHDATDAVAAQA